MPAHDRENHRPIRDRNAAFVPPDHSPPLRADNAALLLAVVSLSMPTPTSLHSHVAIRPIRAYRQVVGQSRGAGVLDDRADDRVPVNRVQLVTTTFEADEFRAGNRLRQGDAM